MKLASAVISRQYLWLSSTCFGHKAALAFASSPRNYSTDGSMTFSNTNAPPQLARRSLRLDAVLVGQRFHFADCRMEQSRQSSGLA